ncbi:MAG: zinc-ribbon domain-containing protein, partial [Spirochaetota bacterium]
MKRSRFFCEHCHNEVRPSARVCPHCGRFFEAV